MKVLNVKGRIRMYISQLDLINFRNFENSKLKFNKGVNTIIGENSAGKSNVLYALRLLLDDNLPLSATKLIESDFNSLLSEKWKGHWIILKITFSDLDNDVTDSLITHNTQNIEQEDGKGTFTFYFRPKEAIRKELYSYSQQIEILKSSNQDVEEVQKGLNNFINQITLNDYEAVYTSRGSADFTIVEQYNEIVGDFERQIFPNPDNDDNEKIGNKISHITSIKKEVSCTYVKALRNVIYELKQRRKSPLLQLLRGSTNNIEIVDTQNIKKKIQDINSSISKLDEIHDLTEKLKSSLNRTLGLTYSPNVDIKSELPEEIETLFQSLTLWVADDSMSKQGKLDDLSLGGANLIYITLKLLEYEFYQDTEEKAAHFLLIEEPEAHIHTHVQKTLFDKYHFDNTQVIITTHSTHISSASNINSMNILIKKKGRTEICHPSNGLSPDKIKKIERYLDATRSTLLFAKGIILVEGDAEIILIPEMIKKVFGITLDELGISIINMSSAVFDNIAELFSNDRIRRRCAIITDLDTSLIKLPEDENEDTDEEKRERSAQNIGANRRRKLEEKYSDNPWVKMFYAEYTFEADYVLNNNEREIVNILHKIYKNSHSVDNATEKLNDSSSKANEALRLANKVGKGWFALLLAEEINRNTNIPEYILSAVAFAANHITEQHIKMMAGYRILELYGEEYNQEDDKNLQEMLEILNSNGQDILVNFINKLRVYNEL